MILGRRVQLLSYQVIIVNIAFACVAEVFLIAVVAGVFNLIYDEVIFVMVN